MIYYGDEAGLEGEYAEDGRRAMPWDTPDQQLTHFYRTAIRARRASAALSLGEIATIWIDDAARSYGFVRTFAGEQVIVLLNASDKAVDICLNISDFRGVESDQWVDLLERLPPACNQNGRLNVTLPPWMAGWYAPSH